MAARLPLLDPGPRRRRGPVRPTLTSLCSLGDDERRQTVEVDSAATADAAVSRYLTQAGARQIRMTTGHPAGTSSGGRASKPCHSKNGTVLGLQLSK